jgi:ribonuclease HI
MELTAAKEAISAVPSGASIVLTTSSTYLQRGVTEWMDGWKANGWRTGTKGYRENKDLWKDLDRLKQTTKVRCEWFKSGTGKPMNDEAGDLARSAIPK